MGALIGTTAGKIIAGVAGVALLAAGLLFWLLLNEREAHGATQEKLKASEAVVRQNAIDRALSARLVDQLRNQVAMSEANAAPVRIEIIRERPTSTCGPAVGIAVDGVWRLHESNGGPAAGRQPTPAVRAPDAGTARGN